MNHFNENVLNEAVLFTPEEITKLKDKAVKNQTTLLQQIRAELEEGKNPILPNYPTFSETVKKVLQNSFSQNGYDTLDNQFLAFMQKAQNTPIAKLGNSAYPALDTLREILAADTIKLSSANLRNQKMNWMYDPQSYNADDNIYKIKVLAFLSSAKSDRFGQTKTKPFDQVVKSTSKAQIQDILDEWNTKDGDDYGGSRRRSSRIGSRGKTLTASEQKIAGDVKKEIFNIIKKSPLISDRFKDNEQAFEDLFNKNYSQGDKVETLIAKMLRSSAENR